MRIVAVDAPGTQNPVDGTLGPRPADVIDNLILSTLLDRLADAPGDICDGFLPGHRGPLSIATLAGALHRSEDPVWILDLVQRCRTLRAVAAAASGMDRIAFELANLPGLFVDVCQQSACGLAVETSRRHKP